VDSSKDSGTLPFTEKIVAESHILDANFALQVACAFTGTLILNLYSHGKLIRIAKNLLGFGYGCQAESSKCGHDGEPFHVFIPIFDRGAIEKPDHLFFRCLLPVGEELRHGGLEGPGEQSVSPMRCWQQAR
jgi:hypothetical protein